MLKDFRSTVPCVFFNSGVKAKISFTDVSTFTSRIGKFVNYRAVIKKQVLALARAFSMCFCIETRGVLLVLSTV